MTFPQHFDRAVALRPEGEAAALPDRPRAHGWGRKLLAPALGLAALALYNEAGARAAERRHRPFGRFIEVEGVKLRVMECGQGEPVLLLHGNGAMIEDFALSGLLDAVTAERRAIVFDRPGYGFSARPRRRVWTPAAQAELFARALDSLGVERVTVLGHSWGAMVAVALALLQPSRIRGLVLVSGYYYPTRRADVPLLAPPAIPVIGDVLRYTIAPPLGRLLLPALASKIFAPAPVPERFRDGFPFDLALRPSQLRAAAEEAGIMIPAAAAAETRYGELGMPVAVVTGDGDRLVDPGRQSARLAGELPHAELVTVPGAGHMVHYQAPDRIAAVVDSVGRRALGEGAPAQRS